MNMWLALWVSILYPKQRAIVSYKEGVDMRIIPKDIAHKTFDKKMFGYNVEEVLDFLQMVAHEMEALIKENNNLKDSLRDKEIQVLKHKERDKTLKDTIETAQKMSQKIREESDREGKLIINDAQQKANFIIRDAKDSLKRIYHEISDLKRTKVQIEANLRALLQAHLQLLNEQITALPEISTSNIAQQEMVPQSFVNESDHPFNDKEPDLNLGTIHKKDLKQPEWADKNTISHRSVISPVSS